MKTINCENFSTLDYEFALEKGQKIILFEGTKGKVINIKKPYLDIELEDESRELGIHWMNVRTIYHEHI